MHCHVWFVTKYRKPILQDGMERAIKDIFAECIQRHKYKVLEYETNKDHVHLLVEVNTKEELSAVVRTLKSVSSREIHLGLCLQGKCRYHRRKPVEKGKAFWATRYGYRQVQKIEIEKVRRYIRNQKKEQDPMLPHGECN
ncbi:MAG: IS200/IS605 family transposase [Candidatus Omnitrophota bacterium]